ncbi:MAG: 50S ribosomal protein L44e [archaeon]
MKIPKKIKLYCKKCNAHTEHKLKQAKTRKARANSFGTRRFERKHKKGYGGKAKFTIKAKKQTKKPNFTAECIKCQMKKPFSIPKRMKKTELV